MNSFRWQCVFPALLAGLLVGGLGVVICQHMADAHARDTDNLLKAKTWILVRFGANGPEITDFREESMNIVEEKIFLQVFDKNRNLISASSNLPSPIPLSVSSMIKLFPYSGPGPTCLLETLEDARGEKFRIASGYLTRGPTAHDREISRVGMSLRDRDVDVRHMRNLFMVAAPLTTGLILLATWLPWHRGRRRIAAMEEDTQAIPGDGTPLRRINVPDDDPALRGLAAAFNQLLDRIEPTREAQQSVLADAAHELRTPLTILQGEIDVILRKDRSAEQYREVLESNREEIERLARLVANLLALARSEVGKGPVDLDAVLDLAALTREVCEKLTPLARAKGITLVCETDFPVLMSGNAVSLEDVVFNLTENAIRYSPRDESVHLRVKQADGEIQLEVQDHGRGIPAEEIPRIFNRFCRLNGSRTNAPDGVGLGLAIVKAVVKAHGGRVEVKSQLGQGTTFIVAIPQTLPVDRVTSDADPAKEK